MTDSPFLVPNMCSENLGWTTCAHMTFTETCLKELLLQLPSFQVPNGGLVDKMEVRKKTGRPTWQQIHRSRSQLLTVQKVKRVPTCRRSLPQQTKIKRFSDWYSGRIWCASVVWQPTTIIMHLELSCVWESLQELDLHRIKYILGITPSSASKTPAPLNARHFPILILSHLWFSLLNAYHVCGILSSAPTLAPEKNLHMPPNRTWHSRWRWCSAERIFAGHPPRKCRSCGSWRFFAIKNGSNSNPLRNELIRQNLNYLI